MGLDSYLFRRGITDKGKVLSVLKSDDESSCEKVAYWRKNWEIHEFFSKFNADGEENNCVEIPITKENLNEFVDSDILEVDDLELIENLIEETDFDNEEIFYYAWY